MSGNHSYWQFRGSIFIYPGRPHIAFLVLALVGAPRERMPMPRSLGWSRC
jgi:hypothetical protein